MRLLLLSNSTNAGEAYLSYPETFIKSFLGVNSGNFIFIPYAAVTFSFDEYENKVKERFTGWGYNVTSVHHYQSPFDAVAKADGVIIGGGNTFQLLHLLQKNKLIEIIREKVMNNMPYIGWSAGSNVACPTICTTNDMPIICPDNFNALNLVPFQINPHYTDIFPVGFAGETRDQRLTEFLAVNTEKQVIGLREGTMIHIENSNISLKGPYKAKIFKNNVPYFEVSEGESIDFLLK